METVMLKDEDVIRVFEYFGADPRRWPDDRRSAALAHIAASTKSFDSWAREAARLDALLDSNLVPAIRPGLKARMLALPDQSSSTPLALHRDSTIRLRAALLPGRYWQAAAGLVVAAVLGFMTGIQLPQEGDSLEALDISAFMQGVTQDEEELL
jgi:hypothetical protein